MKKKMKSIEYYQKVKDTYNFYELLDTERLFIINNLISQEFVDKLLQISETLGYEVIQ
jgi:hypothetical protein